MAEDKGKHDPQYMPARTDDGRGANGRFLAVQEAGYFFAIPLLDRISYVVDMREKLSKSSHSPRSRETMSASKSPEMSLYNFRTRIRRPMEAIILCILSRKTPKV